MKTALVIGGSGVVGSELIKLLLHDERYQQINALVRKPLGIKHDKLNQIRYNFDWPNKELVQGDDFFCSMGTTFKNAGSAEAFRRVDYTYVLETAQFALENGAQKMVLVSSLGANKDSTLLYPKTKGEIEEAVSQLLYKACFILRPSLLMGARSELRMGELVGKLAMTAFSPFVPGKYKGIDAKQVAKAMIGCMNTDKEGVHIIESDLLWDY